MKRLNKELDGVVGNLRGMRFPELVGVFSQWLSPEAVAVRADSRERIYTDTRTFWMYLGQIVRGNLACDAIILDALEWLKAATGRTAISTNSSGYTQARERLPTEMIRQVREQINERMPRGPLFHGHAVKQFDGTGLTMTDTEANRQAYPDHPSSKKHSGFPALNLMGAFDWFSGVLLDWTTGDVTNDEKRLFMNLWPGLNRGDLVNGDRGFCGFGLFWWLQHHRGVDCVTRLHARRKHRRVVRILGPNDLLVAWAKPKIPPTWLSLEEWQSAPEELVVREISADVSDFGFRTRHITIVTTLLDESISAQDWLDLYRRRWGVEVNFRDLKITMGMDILKCKTPAMIEKEVNLFILVYNLIRLIMWEAAERHNVPVAQISFRSTMYAIGVWGRHLVHANTPQEIDRLLRDFYQAIAYRRRRNRLCRSEPRARKRRNKNYQLLCGDRHSFREVPHRGKRAEGA